MSHLQYYILHCPAQCCGAGAGAVAGAGQSRYFWSELEPMKRQEGKKRVLLFTFYFTFPCKCYDKFSLKKNFR